VAGGPGRSEGRPAGRERSASASSRRASVVPTPARSSRTRQRSQGANELPREAVEVNVAAFGIAVGQAIRFFAPLAFLRVRGLGNPAVACGCQVSLD
jgi:hypothetical protein